MVGLEVTKMGFLGRLMPLGVPAVVFIEGQVLLQNSIVIGPTLLLAILHMPIVFDLILWHQEILLKVDKILTLALQPFVLKDTGLLELYKYSVTVLLAYWV